MLFKNQSNTAMLQSMNTGKGQITQVIGQASQLSRWLNQFLFNKGMTPQEAATALGTDGGNVFAAVAAAETFVSNTKQLAGDTTPGPSFLNPGWSFSTGADGTVTMKAPTAAPAEPPQH